MPPGAPRSIACQRLPDAWPLDAGKENEAAGDDPKSSTPDPNEPCTDPDCEAALLSGSIDAAVARRTSNESSSSRRPTQRRLGKLLDTARVLTRDGQERLPHALLA